MTDEQRKALNQELAGFFGQLERHVDARIDGLAQTFTKRFDALESTLDGMAARLDTETTERSALTRQVDRHQDWIGQLAQTTHTKLVPDL